jgi:hypothetical protein
MFQHRIDEFLKRYSLFIASAIVLDGHGAIGSFLVANDYEAGDFLEFGLTYAFA